MAGARRSKLNRKTIGLICDAISIGATKAMAAQYARLSVSALMHWLQIARQDEEAGIVDPEHKLHVELLHAIDDAEGDAAIKWVQVVDAAATTDPAWAWKMLERRYPDGFAPPKQVLDVHQSGEMAVKIDDIRQKRWEQIASIMPDILLDDHVEDQNNDDTPE